MSEHELLLKSIADGLESIYAHDGANRNRQWCSELSTWIYPSDVLVSVRISKSELEELKRIGAETP